MARYQLRNNNNNNNNNNMLYDIVGMKYYSLV